MPLPPPEDVVARLADEPGDGEVLLAAARMLLPAAEHPLAEVVIDGLTSRGFLPAPVDRMAADLGVSTGRLRTVIAALREVGPPGIAAEGVRDCLLAQIEALGSTDRAVVLARAIIADHLETLADGRLGAIASALRASVPEVAAARELIRRRLRPCAVMEGSGRRLPRAEAPPELEFRPAARGGYVVELLEPDWLRLRVSRRHSGDAFRGGPRAAAIAGADARRAHAFLGLIEQRWQTLRLVGESLALHQAAFLHDGPAALVPLTRAQVARELGVHESTVSRAVADKHARLPGGGMVALAGFFAAARGPLDALRDLVAHEARPLPDDALAQAMQRRGFPVARRTVAKYRDSLGIPPAALR